MWILPIIAALFGGAQVFSIVEGKARPGDLLVGGGIAALALGYYLFFRGQRRATETLLRELSSRRGDLEGAGQTSIRGQVVERDAQVRRFTTAISFFFVTVRLQSRFFFPWEAGARSMAITCSFASLLFGWWGIPWGPIWTVQSVIANLKGGTRISVLDLAHGRVDASGESGK